MNKLQKKSLIEVLETTVKDDELPEEKPPKNKPKKLTKVEQTVEDINKRFGQGTIITNETIPDIEKISCGCFSIDRALGGGWGKGRVIEIFGKPSSGKTTLLLETIAAVQKSGGRAAFIDAEHAFDPTYAKILGVDVDSLLFVQPNCGEEAIDVIIMLTNSGIVDFIVVDSVAALVPKAEIEGDTADQNMGLHARLMSKAMRTLTGPTSKTKTTVAFINQMRSKIVMFGPTSITTGGHALTFYASQRVELISKGKLKDSNDNVFGVETLVKVVKNKIARPFQEASVAIIGGKGIDKGRDILRLVLEKGLVTKDKGHRYHYNNVNLGHGENNVCTLLNSNKQLYDELVGKLKE